MAFAIATFVVVPVHAQTSGDGPLHARVSYEAGGGLVKGVEDSEWSYATTNTLVLPGDNLWVDKGGTLELEMSGGVFVRMADGSKAEIVSMPPSTVVRGWTGSFYVQRLNRSTGEALFRTPACSIAIQRDSMVRVDVIGDGATTISVRWGRAAVHTQGSDPVTLTKGMRSYVDPGYLPSLPANFNLGEEDDFDAWNRERARFIAVGSVEPPTGMTDTPIGYTDLQSYGEWVDVDGANYWRPTVVVNYVPYRSGHWSYVYNTGYSWTGHYPFSYVTSHYGRWRHHPTYGWVWRYRPGWGVAYAATVRYGSYCVWSPLDWYDRPVVYGSSHFSVGGVRFGVSSSTYCVASDLYYGPTPVYGCTTSIVTNVHHSNVYYWNIHHGNRPGYGYRPGHGVRPTPLPWYGHGGNSGDRVRDYRPRRMIRGPELAGRNGLLAADRIQSLERAVGRAQFATTRVNNSRPVRTANSATVRRSRMRSVQVNPIARELSTGTIDAGRDNLRAIRDNQNGGGARVARIETGARRLSTVNERATVGTRDSRGGRQVNLNARSSVTSNNGSRTTPGSSAFRAAATRGEGNTRRTTSSAPLSRQRIDAQPSNRTPVRAETLPNRAARDRTEARTPLNDHNNRTGVGNRDRTTVIGDRTNTVRSGVGSNQTTFRQRGVTQDAARDVNRGATTQRTQTPSTSGRTQSVARTQRQTPQSTSSVRTPPSRSIAPRSVSLPQQPSASRSASSSPSRTRSSAPQASISRSAPAPRSAPSRPSVSAPSSSRSSRSASPPSVSRQAPSRPSYSPPSRSSSSSSSSVSRSAPSRPAPSAPSRPSYSAPSRSSSSSAPSRPSYSAPSRSSSGGGSVSRGGRSSSGRSR
jgi:hypothetical protein